MAYVTYDTFKNLLTSATTDVDFVRKNTVMQDATMAGEMANRIAAITPDMNITLEWDQVSSFAGVLQPDPSTQALQFDPLGSGKLLSNYREGAVESPGKIWGRAPAGTSSDGARYLVCDSVKGVLLTDDQLRPFANYPGFTTGTPTTGYGAPSAAITFTWLGTEYIAIAMRSHHIVRIFNYATGVLLGTIGILDTPGLPSTNLSEPTAIAFDETTGIMYISCATGQPVGAISSTGFLATYSMMSSTLDLYEEYYTTSDGSLLNHQVSGPRGLHFDSTRRNLWVVNGNSEVGAISVATGRVVRTFPATGMDYKLSGVSSATIKRNFIPSGTATPGSMSSQAGAFPVTLVHGDTFIGQVDGGPQQTVIINASQAYYEGQAATYAAVPAGTHLDVDINGTTQQIPFTGTESGQASFLSAINSALLEAAAVDSAGQIRIRTDRFGSLATGSILGTTSPEVFVSLGFSVSPFTTGANNVGDSNSVTSEELATLFNVAWSNSVSTYTTDTMTWSSSTAGASSTVQLSAGTGVAKILGFDNFVHVGSGYGSTPVSGDYLYIANSDYGNVIIIDTETSQVVQVIGVRSLEDNSLSQNSVFYGNSGSVDGIIPDTVEVDGVETNVVVVSDAANRRVIRVNEDAFSQVNEAEFNMLSFAVPVSLKGWAVTGTLPSSMVEIMYRFNIADDWMTLSPNACSAASNNIQIKIVVRSQSHLPITQGQINQVILLGHQA